MIPPKQDCTDARSIYVVFRVCFECLKYAWCVTAGTPQILPVIVAEIVRVPGVGAVVMVEILRVLGARAAQKDLRVIGSTCQKRRTLSYVFVRQRKKQKQPPFEHSVEAFTSPNGSERGFGLDISPQAGQPIQSRGKGCIVAPEYNSHAGSRLLYSFRWKFFKRLLRLTE